MGSSEKFCTKEIVLEIAKRMGCYHKDVREVLDIFADIVASQTREGKQVYFASLGTFYCRPSSHASKDGIKHLLVKFIASKRLRRMTESESTDNEVEPELSE